MFTPLFILAPTLELQKKTAFANTPFGHETAHPDLLIIQETPSIGIETVRDLITWSHTKPFSLQQKVVIVAEAGRMTPQAQNALLKTLEEPPEFLQIIMTGTSELGVLETVRSRCRVMRVQPKKEHWVESSGKAEETTELFVWPTTLSSAIEQAEGLAKDREEAIDWCEKTLLNERLSLERYAQNAVYLDIGLRKVKHLAHAIRLLKRNVNTKLVVEDLFFHTRSPLSVPLTALAKPETIG